MAIAEVSIVPVGTGSTSISRYVAEAVRVLQGEEVVKHHTTGMGFWRATSTACWRR